MILTNVSGLIASVVPRQVRHGGVAQILARLQLRLLSHFILAERDYLVAELAGRPAEPVLCPH